MGVAALKKADHTIGQKFVTGQGGWTETGGISTVYDSYDLAEGGRICEEAILRATCGVGTQEARAAKLKAHADAFEARLQGPSAGGEVGAPPGPGAVAGAPDGPMGGSEGAGVHQGPGGT